MTRDELIELARQVDLVSWLPNATFSDGYWWIEAHEPSEELEKFAQLVRKHTCNDLANQIDKMPFGDTAASFAVWIREQA